MRSSTIQPLGHPATSDDRSSPHTQGTESAAPTGKAVPVPDFRTVFESMSEAVIVILADDPVFTVLAASDEYVRVSGIERKNLIGRGLFQVFPENPEAPGLGGVRGLRASLVRVLTTGLRDQIPVQRYDVKRSEEDGGEFEERYWATCNTPILGADGAVKYLIHTAEEVTHHVRAMLEIKAKEQQLHLAQGAGGVGTFEWFIKEDRMIWSPEVEALYGIAEGTFEGTYADWNKRVVPEDAERVAAAIQDCVSRHEPEYMAEFRAVLPDGSRCWLRGRAQFVYDAAGAPERMIGVNIDIDAQKRAEERVKQQWRIFDTALSNSPDLTYIFDLEGRFTYANKAMLELCQKSLDEVIGRNCFDLNSPVELAERLQHQIQHVIETKELLRDQVAITPALGPRRDYEYILVPVLGAAGQVERVAASARDITDRQRAEDMLRVSLNERDTLLKEIHHRVKNNLQVIVSLLSLQSDQITDQSALSAFRHTQSRVRTIAQIHETLYNSADLAHVEFGQYARELVKDLLAFYDVQQDRIDVELATEDMVIDITQAIPLGLILNELVVNCLNHAFPDDRTGTVKISLRYLGENIGPGQTLDEAPGQLCVEDNGIGLPRDFDYTKAKSMGMYLVRILTRQLHGKLEVYKNAGTRFCVTFPLAINDGAVNQ